MLFGQREFELMYRAVCRGSGLGNLPVQTAAEKRPAGCHVSGGSGSVGTGARTAGEGSVPAGATVGGGVGSDIQAFGYDENEVAEAARPGLRSEWKGLWRIYRQELFFIRKRRPFVGRLISRRHSIRREMVRQ